MQVKVSHVCFLWLAFFHFLLCPSRPYGLLGLFLLAEFELY
nr:MAG TPA: hypothetical protein [Caudoviricetes sp.]